MNHELWRVNVGSWEICLKNSTTENMHKSHLSEKKSCVMYCPSIWRILVDSSCKSLVPDVHPPEICWKKCRSPHRGCIPQKIYGYGLYTFWGDEHPGSQIEEPSQSTSAAAASMGHDVFTQASGAANSTSLRVSAMSLSWLLVFCPASSHFVIWNKDMFYKTYRYTWYTNHQAVAALSQSGGVYIPHMFARLIAKMMMTRAIWAFHGYLGSQHGQWVCRDSWHTLASYVPPRLVSAVEVFYTLDHGTCPQNELTAYFITFELSLQANVPQLRSGSLLRVVWLHLQHVYQYIRYMWGQKMGEFPQSPRLFQ